MTYQEPFRDSSEEPDFVVAVSVDDLTGVGQARDFSARLNQQLELARRQGRRRVALDFGSVDRVSSAGLNELILVNSHARCDGLRLVLLDVQQGVREVFTVTRLERLFDFAESTVSVGDT